MTVNYEVREILNIGHQELGVTKVPEVETGLQKIFGRRLCFRMKILAASAGRHRRSMTVNYEVREEPDLIGTEAAIKQSTQTEEIK